MITFTEDFAAVIPFWKICLPSLGPPASNVPLFSLTVIAILLVPAGGQRSFYVHEFHKKYGPDVRITPEVNICNVAAKQFIHTPQGCFSATTSALRPPSLPNPVVIKGTIRLWSAAPAEEGVNLSDHHLPPGVTTLIQLGSQKDGGGKGNV
ncbi:hypothetical protein NEUTE1DRAFT_132736 [Neurospora tetrasperma FGSC 2508]|uniref:Uncharacterized protein n=1 Tax=Neurospora tetrasperma (strain FGSC 2508 / ATCC MYA-4615 / P0657) TaxID=510951 RepID=F8MYT8_NEUT8|nr:uncharacterized protein NEUTE1DRAFT_132736 [Neurospora tetrasperma FGSC 2508]EGO51936.1 hypothetical protein NEUTE1DRAFT_132736 [Neurospora tetrasperma FGSC 2508]